MNEHSFVKSIHRVLPSSVYRWKIHDTYTGGVPDALYAGPKGIVFVEYKWVKIPARPKTLVNFNLSKLQLNWLNLFHMYGQSVIVAVGNDCGVLILSKGQWNKSFTAEEVERESKPKKDFINGLIGLTQDGIGYGNGGWGDAPCR